MPAVPRRSIALAGAAVLLLAGCGSSTAADPAANASTTSQSPSSAATGGGADSSTGAAGDPATVAIVITAADGCAVSPDTVAAGPVTFTVTNQDAVGVSEVELLSDQRIRGERENLAPGFDSTFSVTLDGGSYEVYCPGAASNERVAFTVTGDAAVPDGDVAALLQQATVDYADVRRLAGRVPGRGGRRARRGDRQRRSGSGQGRLRRSPAVLRADRAGGRVVRRSRPGDRPARRRRRGRHRVDRASTRSSNCCSRPARWRGRRRWPTSW